MKTLLSVLAVIVFVGCASCIKKETPPPLTTANTVNAPAASTAPAAAPATGGAKVTLPGGLIYEDLVVGTGAEAKAGKMVSVHYTGWLQSNNQKFDSSVDRGQPFKFGLGAGQVIKGWDNGVAGMKVGGKRKLTIPPEMGYGAAGAGGVIPPNATLLFDVELLGID